MSRMSDVHLLRWRDADKVWGNLIDVGLNPLPPDPEADVLFLVLSVHFFQFFKAWITT